MPRLLALAFVAAIVFAAACGSNNETSNPTSPAVETLAPTAAETPSPSETPPAAQVPNVAPAADITLPPGFVAYPIATGFQRATSVARAPDGLIFVSERHGIVYRLVDAEGDGVFEQSGEYASGFDTITGIMVAPDGTLYVSSTGKVTTVRDSNSDGVGDERTDIINGLPTGSHQNNGMAIGPDGKLYITNGSDCDDCTEADERSASILQSNLDGSDLRVYARGLRNPYDIAFDSQGRLWATDNGSDTPCATIDELDLIVDGGDYGWPYGNDGCDPLTDGTPPIASLGLHTAATGITAYLADGFPEGYYGGLFATVWGSFFAEPDPYDRVLLYIPINPLSLPDERLPDTVEVDVFGSGLQHPIDVFADGDSLLVLDYGGAGENDANGALYRVLYTGG